MLPCLGVAYLAVAGLKPAGSKEENAERIANVVLDFVDAVKNFSDPTDDGEQLHFRFGVSIGDVVASKTGRYYLMA